MLREVSEEKISKRVGTQGRLLRGAGTHWGLKEVDISMSMKTAGGIQSLGFTGPHWKKKCLEPHIECTNTNDR